ncbi:MAG TPA: hypothetical protein VGK24_05705 [Candidatus Angelobacter sp.]|jgi:hypothetical protein
MPNYPGAANSTVANTVPPLPQAIYVGDQQTVFNAEQPAVPQASISVALGSGPGEVGPKTLSVEGYFSGAPGAFEIDLMTSDTDADGMYQAEGAGITVVNAGSQAFRAEFTGVSANFARLLLKTRTNAVNLTARIRMQ